MTTFEFNNKSFYIDGRLYKKIVEDIVPDLAQKDKDAVFVIDGRERLGKSVWGMIFGSCVASLLKSPFDLSNICMTPLEFRNKIETANKNEVVIYDEAHRGMGSSRALSEINNILKDLMMEMGQKNLLVIVILPTFFLLEKYVALFRARGLFHVYERKKKRGNWVYFNEQRKQQLYMKGKKEFNYNCMKYPKFRGRWLNQYPINEEEYRKKKAQSFKGEKRLTKNEKFMEQRDGLIHIINNELGYKASEISKALKRIGFSMTEQNISKIIRDFKAKS